MSASPRPNIMLLVAEDTGRHHGCYGNAQAHTPAIDRLARQGALFTNGFSTAPVCSASRTALITGRYAFSVGTHHHRSKHLQPPRLFTQDLRSAGYYTNWANKRDFNFAEMPAGWVDACSEWFDDLASGKLADRPWFLYHNFEVTHESGMWEASWKEGHRQSVPLAVAADPRKVAVPPYLPDTPEVRRNIARYLDNLHTQDQQVARALDALERSGQADNTLVIYLSDHGRGLPREKRWCYEAGIHLPLIVRWPGQVEPGSIRTDLVSWVDVAPTILAAAGAPIPIEYPGDPFVGPDARSEPRESVIAGRDRLDEGFDKVRVLRDARWLYVRNDFPQIPHMQRLDYMERMEAVRELREAAASGKLSPVQAPLMAASKPPEELYDCQADPDCLHNLAGLREQAGRLAVMRKELARELAEAVDLGEVSERELVRRGLVENMIPEFDTWRARGELPEGQRFGDKRTVLEMEEAQAMEGGN
ncbi:MAG: sulfatase [Verrucomicrobiota bacterium]